MKATLLASLLLSASAFAQTYTLSSHQHPCGATLTAHLVQTPAHAGVRFNVHSLPHAISVLAIGWPLPAPVQLPHGPCLLFVNPVATVLNTTDAHGDAHYSFAIPPIVPFRVLFQDAVIGFGPTGFSVRATNVIRLTAQ